MPSTTKNKEMGVNCTTHNRKERIQRGERKKGYQES